MDPSHRTDALLELEARGLAVARAARRLRHRAYVDPATLEAEIAALRDEVRAWEGDVVLWVLLPVRPPWWERLALWALRRVDLRHRRLKSDLPPTHRSIGPRR